MGMRLVQWGVVWFALCLLIGCKVGTTDDGDDDSSSGNGGRTIDTDKLKDQVHDAVDNARDVEICPGQTLEELLEADSLSDECREALLSFLPKPQTSFEQRLLAPGGARVADGELHVLLQAADADGAAVSAADLSAGLEVRLTVDGEEQVLASDAFTFASAADLASDLLSVSVINDYSASMLDGDLRDVEQVERALFDCMPPVHETEVIRFSEQVEQALDFSDDRSAIDGALARDDDFERGTTALFDGLGTGLDHLSARERPVHLVILATDGQENSSQTFTKPEVLDALAEPSTFIVVLGGLLADVDLIKELAKHAGVYVYAREFSDLAEGVDPYCKSLSELTELRIPLPEGASVSQLHLVHADLDLDLQLSVEN